MGGGFLDCWDGHAISAGERHEDVDRPELLGDRARCAADLHLIGAVGSHCDCPSARCLDCRGDRGEGVPVTTDDGDGGVVGRHGSGGGRADPTRAAGDHGYLVGEVGIARLS